MRKAMLAVVVAVVAAAPLFVTSPAGAADAHTVTVSPNTGLATGQTVTVTGDGFVEVPLADEAWSVAQCSAAILAEPITILTALADCDPKSEPRTIVPADAAGHFSTPFVVRTSFTTSTDAPVTCGAAANDCAILVAQSTAAGFVAVAVPITFGGGDDGGHCPKGSHPGRGGWHRPSRYDSPGHGHNPWGHDSRDGRGR